MYMYVCIYVHVYVNSKQTNISRTISFFPGDKDGDGFWNTGLCAV